MTTNSLTRSRARWLLLVGNLVLIGLSVLWGYTTYMYNWLNVGGGVGDIDYWDGVSKQVPVLVIAWWIMVILLTLILGKKTGLGLKRQLWSIAFSTSLGVAALVASDWYFHLGFPPLPQI